LFCHVVRSCSSIIDAATACDRLYAVFEAETSDRILSINKNLDAAVRIDNADFTWECPPPRSGDPKIVNNQKGAFNRSGKSKPTRVPTARSVDEYNVFKLQGIHMTIPRGQLVAFVGAVGAGKTSLLQGIIGEMRRIAGTVEFGGSVAYCAQTAWIQVCCTFVQISIMVC
jgi:ATPase subunit of ABC transporter with duplicated ATPase domains